MLSAEQQELITAAVDGELSAPEARAFRQLLASSPEAHELLAQLQADSERVRALPQTQVAPPANLKTKILARIADSTPAPRKLPTKTAAPAKPMPAPLVHPAQPTTKPAYRAAPANRTAWMPVAIAACVLICVTAGSFAFFSEQSRPESQTAKNPWLSLPSQQDTPSVVPSPAQVAPEVPQHDPRTVARVDISPVPPAVAPEPKEVRPQPLPIAPAPRPVPHDFLASGLLPPIPPFDRIQVRVPFLRKVAELEGEDIRAELIEELTHDPTRIDLFVRDTARGWEVFQNAAKASSLTIYADAATLEKLKKHQVSTVVIYVESLTAEELALLFAKLASADTKFSPRVCDSLHATSIVRADEAELKQILGTDVGLYKRPTGNDKSDKLDKHGEKSVSSGTIDSVTKTLTNPAKPAEKPAVLMTWQTTHPSVGRTNPSTSAELKQFLAKRGPRKLDTVPTIIVIRPVG